MNDTEDQPATPILIEPSKLSTEALTGVIESYIMRSGTDYGSVEVSHQTKISQIKKQIDQKEVVVVYDSNTESVTLMKNSDFKKSLRELSSN